MADYSNQKMKRSEVYKMYPDYCEENGRTPHDFAPK